MPVKTKLSSLERLSAEERADLAAVAERFAFRASEYYLRLINWDDPLDPIRRIVIPSRAELPGYRNSNPSCWDPAYETENYVVPGCQHKYPQTAVLLVSGACDSHCRFCFRKRLFRPGCQEASIDTSAGIAYIAAHPEITNVLLTGGDPLTLPAERLNQILTALGSIQSIRAIRIGTKTPAFNPFRILDDSGLISVLRRHSPASRRLYLMVHFDHPRELTSEARRAVCLLQQAGCVVTHQCPLLRGVNDDPLVLAALFNELTALGAAPYYLFHNRPVAGNADFAVPLAEGFRIAEAAKARLSGLARRFRYVLSHHTGKIEILAITDSQAYLKYHQARHPADEGRFLRVPLQPKAAWLDDLPEAGGA